MDEKKGTINILRWAFMCLLSLLVYQLETVTTNRLDAGKFVTTLSNLIEFYCGVIFFRADLLCHFRTREAPVEAILKNSIKISRHGREWKIWLRFSFLLAVSSIMFLFCTTAILGKKLQHHACLSNFLTLLWCSLQEILLWWKESWCWWLEAMEKKVEFHWINLHFSRDLEKKIVMGKV